MKRLALALGLWLGLLAPTWAVVPTTKVGDAAYTIKSTDTFIITTTAFSAGRTWTLPYAAATCIGQTCAPSAGALQIIDVAGAWSQTYQLTIAPQSGDTINGNAANLIISTASRIVLYPTSGNNWQVLVEGDYVATVLAAGSAIGLTSTTAADIVTQSLSQGEWECRGIISRTLGASTSVTVLTGSIGLTTNTQVAQGTHAATYLQTAANVMGALGEDTKVGPVRISLTATATYRLIADDTFSVSTDAAYGELACRRIR